ncbi:hypothetical protein BJ165DRAFT_1399409 [Panaeolus papilionaceus]|nr:hypothetical protein BJ165DRAFT_1399409 [Panaeolus papilionaceus]
MSLGEHNTKFPGQVIPISRNPGQLFPKSDPSTEKPEQSNRDGPAANLIIGNSYLMNTELDKLDHAFSRSLCWQAQLESMRLKRATNSETDCAERILIVRSRVVYLPTDTICPQPFEPLGKPPYTEIFFIQAIWSPMNSHVILTSDI